MNKKTAVMLGLIAVFVGDNVRIGLKNLQLKRQLAATKAAMAFMTDVHQSSLKYIPINQLENLTYDLEFIHIKHMEEMRK